MKKGITLLLTIALLLSAAFALSEETQTEQDAHIETYSSSLLLGKDRETAIDYYKAYWIRSGFTPEEETEEERRTLSDGNTYLVQTFRSGDGSLTGKLYFANDRLIAGFHDFTFPESSDAAAAFERASNLGRSQKLVVADLGIIAELFGDDAHFTDGQDLWTYLVPVTLPGIENTANLPVYLSTHAVDNHVYMAEWLAPQNTENSSSALKLEGMKGYSELTAEEKKSAALYADYLESQVSVQLQQYVDFLLQHHTKAE